MQLADHQYDEAICRLACDVPYFTAKHIDGWFGAADGNAKQRSLQRRSGSLPTLKRLVQEGVLSENSASVVTMDYHRDPVRWQVGYPVPEPFSTACHLRSRHVQLARRSWRLSSSVNFGGHEGFFPAMEAVAPNSRWDNVEKPKTMTIYSATEKTRAEHGQLMISTEQCEQLRMHFRAYQPTCDCGKFLRAALDQSVRISAESRGLAIASFYLDMGTKGRELAPTPTHGNTLPVDFERNWQGLGRLEMEDITPDVIEFFPQFGNQPVAIAISIWCEHAVDAFHRACSAYRLPYFLY